MTQLDTGPPAVDQTTPPRLLRSKDDRVVAGICGGLGQYFNTDPVWFRIAFVVLALSGGAGFLIYLIAWLIIPEAGPGQTIAPRTDGSSTTASVVAGVVLVSAGLILLVNNLVPWFDRVAWPLAVIAAGAGMLYLGSRREHD